MKSIFQLGYEPVAAKKGTNWFGSTVFIYPGSLIGYPYHLYKTHGLSSLFIGLSARLPQAILIGYLNGLVRAQADALYPPIPDDGFGKNSDKCLSVIYCLTTKIAHVDCQSVRQVVRNTLVNVAVGVSIVAITHPLTVISNRMIAQLADDEVCRDWQLVITE